jgi:hypothetical protein
MRDTPEIYIVRGAGGEWLVRCRYSCGSPFTIISARSQREAKRQVQRWRRVAEGEAKRQQEVHRGR